MQESLKKFFVVIVAVVLMMLPANKMMAGQVELGVERTQEYDNLLQGKRVGLLTNQTGVDSKLISTVDRLQAKYNLTAVFVPEHGFYGAIAAGEEFNNATFKGLTVYSLYGDNKHPSAEMLQNIDVLCIDLQDIGVRHYTYVSTMAYAMEACAAAGKPVIVFDRPNPLGGEVDGSVLKPQFKTFIGLYELPLRHGLTIGEYARYINEHEQIKCALTVIPMKHWKRSMQWRDTGLPWVSTSPLIPTAETAALYAATGVAGDTNLSVGVGTAKPFYYVGAPFVDEYEVYRALTALQINGVAFRPAAFIPRYGSYSGQLVKGVEIYLLQPEKVNTSELGYLLVHTLQKLYPEKLLFPKREYAEGYKADIALGEDSLRLQEEPAAVFSRWQQEDAAFKKQVQPYLLYK